MHAFFEMDDSSFLAFFELPNISFEFNQQHGFDLHIALEVVPDDLYKMYEKGKSAGIETRGMADHGFIDSIYFHDPNEYVLELTAKRPDHDDQISQTKESAHQTMTEWRRDKSNV